MLDKAVSALKADKTKTLDLINKGEGGFLDRDLYPFCFNLSDGKIVALARCAVDPREGFCDRGEIRLWDVNAKKEKRRASGGFHDWIRSLAFSNDGQVLATGGCGRRKNSRCIEGELRLWNAQTGCEIGEPIAGHTDVSTRAFWRRARFSMMPDGSRSRMVFRPRFSGTRIRDLGIRERVRSPTEISPALSGAITSRWKPIVPAAPTCQRQRETPGRAGPIGCQLGALTFLPEPDDTSGGKRYGGGQ